MSGGDYGTTNCYFNNDVYYVKEEEEGKRGRSTLQLTSPDFFEKLIKGEGFNPDIWTKKANDKEKEILLNRNFKRVNQEVEDMVKELLGIS